MKAITIFTAGLITVAVVSVLVSQKNKTGTVINASGNALSSSLKAAEDG